MNIDQSQPVATGFRLTGRMVLLILVSFFAVVVSVNLFMAYVAVNTFSGMQTQRPYESGLNFNRDIKSAQVQQEEHWQVSSHHERLVDGRVALSLSLRDAQGQPLEGVKSKVTLVSPVNAANDVTFDLVAKGAGDLSGTAKADAGQWDLVIEITKEGKEVFRSVSRISLR